MTQQSNRWLIWWRRVRALPGADAWRGSLPPYAAAVAVYLDSVDAAVPLTGSFCVVVPCPSAWRPTAADTTSGDRLRVAGRGGPVSTAAGLCDPGLPELQGTTSTTTPISRRGLPTGSWRLCLPIRCWRC